MTQPFLSIGTWLLVALWVAGCSASNTTNSASDTKGPPDTSVVDTASSELDTSADTLEGDASEVSDALVDIESPSTDIVNPDVTSSQDGSTDSELGSVDLCDAVDCDDGDACTGVESCDPSTGKCVPGIPIQCDDGDPCNGKELCAPATGECIAVDIIQCDDNDACNGLETCDPTTGACIEGEIVLCDDADACNGLETCDSKTGECLKGTAVICDDENACNGVESCVSESGECVTTPAIKCDDKDACNGLESCEPSTGECLEGVPVVCDDGDACNGLEVCLSATGDCKLGSPVLCDDGDACNGLESCNPKNGLCQDGEPVICDDGDGCNGIESCDPETGLCVTTGSIGECPVSPSECDEDGDLYGPDGEKSVLAPNASMLRLRDSGTTAGKEEIIKSIKAHPSVQAASYADILSDLNRKGTEVDWVIGVQCFAKGYKFNSGDNWVEHWWPQGFSGSATGQSPNSALVEGHNVQLISWYHKPDEDGSTDVDKGMRLSFVRRTDFDNIRYRNILMVEPVLAEDGTPTFKPVVGHAGGIVWYKNLLYVADTSKGFRVFDMNHMMAVKTGDNDLIGYQPGKNEYHAFNYAYVLPMVNRYKLCEESCCARFSFCSIDMSVSPPRIVAGEYTDTNSNGRVHSWKIEEQTGWLNLDPGQDTATADALFYPAAIRMQGATTYNGIMYVSSSNPKTNWPQTPGTLYVTADGNEPIKRGYPALPEDLHHNHFTGHLWTVTEFPGHRYVFAVHRSDALQGCN